MATTNGTYYVQGQAVDEPLVWIDDDEVIATIETIPSERRFAVEYINGETLSLVIGSLWELGYAEVSVFTNPRWITNLCDDPRFQMRPIREWGSDSLRGWFLQCPVHGMVSLPRDTVVVIAPDKIAAALFRFHP